MREVIAFIWKNLDHYRAPYIGYFILSLFDGVLLFIFITRESSYLAGMNLLLLLLFMIAAWILARRIIVYAQRYSDCAHGCISLADTK